MPKTNTNTTKPAFNPNTYKLPSTVAGYIAQYAKDLKVEIGAKEAQERAIKGILKCYKGKRTQESVTALSRIVVKQYGGVVALSDTISPRFYTSVRQMNAGTINETAQYFWKMKINDLLPAIRVRADSKAKAKAKGSKRASHYDRVEARFTMTLKNHMTVTLAQAVAATKAAWNEAHGK